ncbi:PRC-barrel domain-containing protein [Neotabrizicola sp. VNH66]|uniref:PRC-barrel domain-containing protein n=1 Tax=Neotabrizicola sp. VNH66 TaxID=3400918 RepID=UPI003C118361
MDRKTVSKIPALLVSAALIAAPVMTFAQTATTEPATPEATTPEVMPAAPAETAVAPAETAPAFVVPEGYVAVADMTTLTADTLKGVDLLASDGSSVGEISDVELSADGAVTGVIVDVGGFLGMGTHTVKLMLDQISFYENADKALVAHVAMDKAALEALPEYTMPAQ